MSRSSSGGIEGEELMSEGDASITIYPAHVLSRDVSLYPAPVRCVVQYCSSTCDTPLCAPYTLRTGCAYLLHALQSTPYYTLYLITAVVVTTCTMCAVLLVYREFSYNSC